MAEHFDYNAFVENETLRTILTRLSVRQYKPEQISGDALQQIIDAGLHDPARWGGNRGTSSSYAVSTKLPVLTGKSK